MIQPLNLVTTSSSFASLPYLNEITKPHLLHRIKTNSPQTLISSSRRPLNGSKSSHPCHQHCLFPASNPPFEDSRILPQEARKMSQFEPINPRIQNLECRVSTVLGQVYLSSRSSLILHPRHPHVRPPCQGLARC